jgi:hypothetical protein
VEVVERLHELSTTEEHGWFETSLVGIYGFTWRWNCDGWIVAVVGP